MNNTPFTEKAWDEMPHYINSFGRAIRMREACREMERQRNELLDALENILHHQPQLIGPGVSEAKAAIAKAKGEKP